MPAPKKSNTAASDRLDVWLFRSRLLKSRSLAVTFIEKGKIRHTRDGYTRRIRKPGFRLHMDDQITFMRGTTLLHVEVLGYPERRGPAIEAQKNYRMVNIQTRD